MCRGFLNHRPRPSLLPPPSFPPSDRPVFGPLTALSGLYNFSQVAVVCLPPTKRPDFRDVITALGRRDRGGRGRALLLLHDGKSDEGAMRQKNLASLSARAVWAAAAVFVKNSEWHGPIRSCRRRHRRDRNVEKPRQTRRHLRRTRRRPVLGRHRHRRRRRLRWPYLQHISSNGQKRLSLALARRPTTVSYNRF